MSEQNERVDLADVLRRREIVACVREFNSLALKSTDDEPIALMPFRYIEYGDSETIECFQIPVWDSESSDWNPEEQTIRDHILDAVRIYLAFVQKICTAFLVPEKQEG